MVEGVGIVFLRESGILEHINTINVFLGEEYSEKDSQIILSNYKDAKILGRDIKLRPYEAIVYKVV